MNRESRITFRTRLIVAGLLVALLVLGAASAGYAVATALAAPTVDCDKPVSAPVDENGRFTVTLVCVGPVPAQSTSPSPTPSPSPSVSSSPSPSPSVSPSSSPSATGDTTPPSVPTGLTYVQRSTTSLLVTWAASSDNVGVTGYVFERGTTQLGVTPTPDWLDTGLTADTAYTYRVRARDAAGNLSAYSAVLNARTPAPPPPTPGNNCQANPEACGFPSAISTGPSGALTTITRTQFTTAGETIVNARIPGCVEVRANNVTFRNVEFSGNGGCFTRVRNFAIGLQLIDSYVSCGGANNNGVGNSSVSLLRVEITGCENGLNVSGTTTVTDSWIHDLVTANGAHTDGAQFNQGATDILFQHNTIFPAASGVTSAIIMWNEGDPQNARVTIAGNLLAGGSYTLYCGRTGAVDNVRILNNRFGTFTFGRSDHCGDGEVWTGNVRDDTGAVIGP